MLRIAAVLAMVACVGCYGDMVSTSASAGPDGGAEPLIPIDPATDMSCLEAQATTDDGYHFEGQSCLGCHNGSVGPEFGVGGTLYADAEGTIPVAGAAIHILDADGAIIELTSSLNGNFWTPDPVASPFTVWASSCPDLSPMPYLSGSGDCNSCHAAGARMIFSP